jgi:flagellar hook-associated protein 1 FlgK
MSDLLNTAVSGLMTYQRALGTVSHNISNVNTPGYSRQTADLATRSPQYIGGNYLGSGVNIQAVSRYYDQFMTDSVRDSNSSFYRLDKFSALASNIDDILADPVGGISPILQDFFTAVQGVSDDPASNTARLHMINTANALANRMQTFDTRLQQLETNSATDIRTTVGEINDLVEGIRQINVTIEQMARANGATEQSADLLDQRDALIDELSKRVDITVVNGQSPNEISIMIGNGQTVLNGMNAFKLEARPDAADPRRDVIVYEGVINQQDISEHLTGGELGGLLDFRSQVLNVARNSLGRVAIGLAESFNAQHRAGMDLNGNLGGDFFAYAGPVTTPFSTNNGNATMTTTITDVSQLTREDYVLSYDGANWQLTAGNGSTTSIADASPANTVIQFEGLEVVIDGASAPVAGDQFTIRPTLDGAREFRVLIDDPNLIAAAAPVRAQSSLQNLGDVSITPGTVIDSSNPNLLDTVNLVFDDPPASFTADAAVTVGGTTYAAGTAIPWSNDLVVQANGWQVTLSGIPQAGDRFTVEHNLGGDGDNRNALELAGLQTRGLFDGGRASYQEAYAAFVGEIGTLTATANVERDAQQSLLTQAEDRRSSFVGVNLDEEAADMIRFQQAYEATARLITTAQTVFDTLINSLR